MCKNLKYKRGTVWYYVDAEYIKKYSKHDSQDCVLHGSRPVLIISDDSINAKNDNVIVIKISSKFHSSGYRKSASFETSEGTSFAVTDQIATVSKSNLIEYQYTLCDDDMHTVEKSLLSAIGCDLYVEAVDARYSFDQFKSVVEGIVTEKVNELLVTVDRPVDAKYIQNLTSSLVESKVPSVSQFHVDHVSDSTSVTDDTSTDRTVRSKMNSKWTTDRMRNFLNDYKVLSTKELQLKYHISSVSTVYNCAYRFKKMLKSQENT